jgi:hypothetical protein
MSLSPKEQTFEWVISTEDWNWEMLNASAKMPMEFYDSRTVSWFQRTLSFAARSWMRLTTRGILSIREPIKCIRV